MGFHTWIVYKTMAVLDDVSSIIILKHGRRFNRPPPSKAIYVLLRHRYSEILRQQSDCFTARNCVLIDDKNHSGDNYTLFDAVMFGQESSGLTNSPGKPFKALNVFTSTFPPDSEAVCDISYDDFFNLTFSYRLDSDVVLKRFVVRKPNGDIIAPGVAPPWGANLSSLSNRIRSIIKRKRKAVAYLNYNCKLESSKGMYYNKLEEIFTEYALNVDTYNCSYDCDNERCGVTLPDEYYFYIIFENYFAEDYVTNRILDAYDNYVVPILYGGANLSRFLPPHSYIDGRSTKPRDVVAAIRDSMDNSTLYEEYFKWRNLYTVVKHQPFCDLCDILNTRGRHPKPVGRPMASLAPATSSANSASPEYHIIEWLLESPLIHRRGR
ncbi:unnamed protein product, partial [Iphiclides podalirius]